MTDLLIRGGRVIDPESGHDAVADVAVSAGRITAVGTDLGPATRVIDAAGLVVAPGFIDLHAHGQSIPADRMQAFDGVTTALELELGVLPVARWYDEQAHAGRVLNYGASTGWVFARIAAMTAQQVEPTIEGMGRAMRDGRWSEAVATAAETADILDRVRAGLEQGGIGIGFPNAYAPGSGVKEMSELCSLAAGHGAPTFTHIAYASNIDPHSSVEAYTRLIGYAGSTGAHMHICHFNSTSLQDVERAAQLVRTAQAQGLKVTVEAYPYGTGSTVVGAVFFADPEFPARTGTGYPAVEVVSTGRRFASRDELLAAQQDDPGSLVLWHFLDVAVNQRHRDLLDVSVLFPGGAIASDAVPWTLNGATYSGGGLAAAGRGGVASALGGHVHALPAALGAGAGGAAADRRLGQMHPDPGANPGRQHSATAAEGAGAGGLRCRPGGVRPGDTDRPRRVQGDEPGGRGHAACAGRGHGGHHRR